ncbi:MAG TPA: GNAT family N-acetyltransferase [Chitinophagaceae bacterium]
MIITETDRLILREFHASDAEDMFHLNADPDVIRYTHNLPFKSISEAREFILNYTHYKDYGFGRWAVINKSDNSWLGWCGLKYTPDIDEYDIGFRFFKKYWNKGYATESALASIDVGFNRLKIPTIIGRAMSQNTASIRVLEKIGLVFMKKFDFEGEEGVMYKMDNPLM